MCIPTLTQDTDQPFWVARDSFYKHFDQSDFHFRDSQRVSWSYLSDWFFSQTHGQLHFILPTVHFVSGKTQFINGRHRTAVLLHHMNEVPMAFALGGFSDLSVFHSLDKRQLNLSASIELPDLPVVERLP